MNTSEPVAGDARTRSRPETPDDPTIWEVDDALWARLAPLLVNGVIWMARTGAQWAALPARYGPKSTVHARFQEWVARDVFAQLWAVLLDAYDDLVGVEWQWQAADGCLVKAPLGKRGLQARRKRPGAIPPTAASVASNVTS